MTSHLKRESHATTVILAVDDGTERFKIPQQEANAVRDTVESILTAHYGVKSIAQHRTQNRSTVTTPEMESALSFFQNKSHLSVDGTDSVGATTEDDTITKSNMDIDTTVTESEESINGSIICSDADSHSSTDTNPTTIPSESNFSGDQTASQSQLYMFKEIILRRYVMFTQR